MPEQNDLTDDELIKLEAECWADLLAAVVVAPAHWRWNAVMSEVRRRGLVHQVICHE
jgi:hypothetical protein